MMFLKVLDSGGEIYCVMHMHAIKCFPSYYFKGLCSFKVIYACRARDHADITYAKLALRRILLKLTFIFVNLFFLSIDLLSFLRNYVNSTSTWGRALCQTEHSVAKAWMMDPFT